MKPFCVATFARVKGDDNNARAVNNSIDYLKSMNVPVVFADGGSDGEFIDKVQDLERNTDNFHLIRPDSGSQQGTMALEKAAALYDVVFLIEGDKDTFFVSNLFKSMDAYRTNGYDSACIARDREVWKSFPEFQIEPEEVLNRMLTSTLGDVISATDNHDFIYGGKILSNQVAMETALNLHKSHRELFKDADGTGLPPKFWEFQFGTMGTYGRLAEAGKVSGPLGMIYTAVNCPEHKKGVFNGDKTIEELIAQRKMQQFPQNLRGYAAGWRSVDKIPEELRDSIMLDYNG